VAIAFLMAAMVKEAVDLMVAAVVTADIELQVKVLIR